MTALLEVEKLEVGFGATSAVRGASIAVCGSIPKCMTFSMTWSIAWICTSPPGVPNGITPPSSVTRMAGLGVSRGRLPGASELGWFSSSHMIWPRVPIGKPSSGTTGEPCSQPPEGVSPPPGPGARRGISARHPC